MNSNDIPLKLDYNDVLLLPKKSHINTRKEITLDSIYKTNTSSLPGCVPIIISNMKTTGTIGMLLECYKKKVLVCLHKFYTIKDLLVFFAKNRELSNYCFVTVGSKPEDLKNIKPMKDLGVNICIDVANGYSPCLYDQIKRVRDVFPDNVLMAGNVCTPEGCEDLISHGVDIIKAGIGGGSVCTTRLKTGIGYPMFSMIRDCIDVCRDNGVYLVADGGCSQPSDLAKAFAAGSDFVMLGGMIAGTDECEGDWEYESIPGSRYGERKLFKFYGMASHEAMNALNGGCQDYKTAEGKCVKIPYKGTVESVLNDILGGLRSACAYTSSASLKDLKNNSDFIRVNNTHNRIYE